MHTNTPLFLVLSIKSYFHVFARAVIHKSLSHQQTVKQLNIGHNNMTLAEADSNNQSFYVQKINKHEN